MEKKLIAIETDKVDKTLGPREIKLFYSDGTHEICNADDPKMQDRLFAVGTQKDLQ